uniref:Uncharacterized protein n=1 Tax=Oryza nivara TaxID=4536 RepID=A0A0E0ILP2_ORYNI
MASQVLSSFPYSLAGTRFGTVPPPPPPPRRAAARVSLRRQQTSRDGALLLRSLTTTRSRCAPAADGGGAKEAAEAAGDPVPDDELWPWDEFPEDAVFVKDDFATVQARFSRESGEAAAALKDAAADVFRPLLDNFSHLRSLNTVFDTEDYHVGMPFVNVFCFAVEILGMLIACIGCYNLFKMNPTTFIDAALGYTFYRLCIVSSQLRRRGFSNDLIIRVKFSQLTLHPQSDSAVSYFLKANSFGIANVVMVVMAINDINNRIYWLDAIRAPVYFLYGLTFAFELAGIKKCVKYLLASVALLVSHEKGRRELRKLLPKFELAPASERLSKW